MAIHFLPPETVQNSTLNKIQLEIELYNEHIYNLTPF